MSSYTCKLESPLRYRWVWLSLRHHFFLAAATSSTMSSCGLVSFLVCTQTSSSSLIRLDWPHYHSFLCKGLHSNPVIFWDTEDLGSTSEPRGDSDRPEQWSPPVVFWDTSLSPVCSVVMKQFDAQGHDLLGLKKSHLEKSKPDSSYFDESIA